VSGSDSFFNGSLSFFSGVLAKNIYYQWGLRIPTLRMCLDGERSSVRITLFGLVVENSVMLVIFREM
jgi:hypothetical protein